MSGSLFQALLALHGGGQGPNNGVNMPPIPLASMINQLSPNAIDLQKQNAALPWYAVPGMFKAQPPPPVATPAPAAPAPAQSPDASSFFGSLFGAGNSNGTQ